MRLLTILLLCLGCDRALAQDPKCAGKDCLVSVKTSHGARCGAPDSMEMDVKNVSDSLYLRGYVVFLTPTGTQNEATGLLAPGETANVYACHVLGTPSFLANTSPDKNTIRYPDTKVRDSSGLVMRECDSDPDDRVQICRNQNSECKDNADPWCAAQQEKSTSCVASRIASCDLTQTRCMARIRRCEKGQVCAAGVCVSPASR